MLQKLMDETIKFIELCQDNVLNGKIDIDSYNTLSQYKISFINQILNSSDRNKLFIDNDFKARIDSIFKNEEDIHSTNIKYIKN